MLFECERQPVEMIVHKLELAGPGQRMRNMQSLPDPAVQLSILCIAMRADTVESRRRHRIERCEESHVNASRYKPFSEQARDRLPRPVVLGRRPP